MSDLLTRNGFSFQKKYGQNFLQDVKIPRRIAAECTAYENGESGRIRALILEIGPGAGILTKELAAVFERVVAVEIDTSLKPVLDESLKGIDNAEIVFGDIMETELHALLDERRKATDGFLLPVTVCANLPYYITTPILMKLLESRYDFDYITVMVQKEVAVRLTSPPGTAEYGAITASIGLYASVKRLFTVPSGCFYPRPKVDSAVIRLSLHRPSRYTDTQIVGASALIKAAFSVRRKTLINALGGAGYDKAAALAVLSAQGYDAAVRGETLSTDAFVRLYDGFTAPTADNKGGSQNA